MANEQRLAPGIRLKHVVPDHGQVLRLTWSPGREWLAILTRSRRVVVWDAAAGAVLGEIQAPKGKGGGVAWSPDGVTLAVATEADIDLWQVPEFRHVTTLPGESGPIENLLWSPDGSQIAATSDDSMLYLWDTATKGCRACNMGRAVLAMDWAPDGQRIAVSFLPAGAGVYSVATDKLYPWPYMAKRPVTCLRWDSDESLYIGKTDRSVECHAVRDEQTNLVVRLEGHTSGLNTVDLSWDGRLLLSQGNNGAIRIWRTGFLREVAATEGLVKRSWAPLQGLAAHRNRPVFAAVSGDRKSVRIWEIDLAAMDSGEPEEQPVTYTTAKLVLLGDSGVGKTGLGYRLAKGEFKAHPSTHGQQFWVLDQLRQTRRDGTECEAVLWDLAGQPDYRLVHTLFVGDTDLALILFDASERQEPLKAVEYWLKVLGQEQRRRCRVLLVGARADRGEPSLTSEELDRFCAANDIDGWLITSSSTGQGVDRLLERLRSLIPWDEKGAIVTTHIFKEIKDCVTGLREGIFTPTEFCSGETPPAILPMAELRRQVELRCGPSLAFTDAELATAVGHLQNHGFVALLPGPSGEQYVLLQPDLLNNLAASFVLEARRNPKSLGALDEGRVRRGDYAFPELAPLTSWERERMLDAAAALFLRQNVCFRQQLGVDSYLVFPALINEKKPPAEVADIEADVSYTITGAVENIYAALVVLLGYTNTFTRTHQWQHQAQYELDPGEVCGFRQTDERNGEVDLTIYYGRATPPAARMAFQGLFERFIARQQVQIRRYPPARCPECGYTIDRGEVVRRVKAGKDFLFCSECGAKFPLPKAGETLRLVAAHRRQVDRDEAHALLRTRFEEALVHIKRTATREAPSCFVSYAWGDKGHEQFVRKRLAPDLRAAGVAVTLDVWNNADISDSLPRFMADAVRTSDFVLVVGTPAYLAKFRNEDPERGTAVAAEMDAINVRLTGTEAEKKTVLPVLLAGTEKTALPDFLWRRAFADFRREEQYFLSLFHLVRTLFGAPARELNWLCERLESPEELA